MQKRITFTMLMLKRLSKELDYKLNFDWKTGDFGSINFSNGVKHYFSRVDIRVNRIGPYLLAGSKYYTDIFLKKNKYPVIKSDIFFSESYCRENNTDKGIIEAIKFGNTLSYPLIVKPNNGMHGNGVQRVDNENDLQKALLSLFKNNEKVIIQRFVYGDDYRIVVYNGAFISAYRRVPFTIVGDGGSTIQELIDERVHEYGDAGRKFVLELQKIKVVLRRNKLRLSSVLERGTKLHLLDNANLHAGGYAEDVSDSIHKDYKQAAINASYDLGLRLSGVDLMIDGDVTKKPKKNKWFFLELNASPGFHNFADLNERAYKRIENLYRKILKDIKNKKLGH